MKWRPNLFEELEDAIGPCTRAEADSFRQTINDAHSEGLLSDADREQLLACLENNTEDAYAIAAE